MACATGEGRGGLSQACAGVSRSLVCAAPPRACLLGSRQRLALKHPLPAAHIQAVGLFVRVRRTWSD